jgi:hypothetical protein
MVYSILSYGQCNIGYTTECLPPDFTLAVAAESAEFLPGFPWFRSDFHKSEYTCFQVSDFATWIPAGFSADIRPLLIKKYFIQILNLL